MEHYNPVSEAYIRQNYGVLKFDKLYEEARKEKPRYDVDARRPPSWFKRRPSRISTVPNAYGAVFTEPGYRPGHTYGIFDEHDIPDKGTIKYSKTLANLRRDYDDPVRKEETFSEDLETLKAAHCQEDLGFNEFYYEQLRESLKWEKVLQKMRIALMKNNYVIGRSFCSYITVADDYNQMLLAQQ